MKDLQFLRLTGSQGRDHVDALAALRLKVFWEFPYLYEGTLDYERNYLETYFRAGHSFILLVKDTSKDLWVGATTGIWAQEEEESFRLPFTKAGIDPKQVFYFGESILLPEYRGQGLGKVFFKEREEFARSLGFIKYLSFAAVVRSPSHPLRPHDHRDLDSFWNSQGFGKRLDLQTEYHWKDREETSETSKTMQFWIKEL